MRLRMQNIKESKNKLSYVFKDDDYEYPFYIKKNLLPNIQKISDLENAIIEVSKVDVIWFKGWYRLMNFSEIKFNGESFLKKDVEKQSFLEEVSMGKLQDVNHHYSIKEDDLDVNKKSNNVVSEKNRVVNFANNKKKQELINKTLESNSRILFYSKVAKTRGVDYGEIKFFDQNKSLEFLKDESLVLKLISPKQLDSKELSINELEKQYSDFFSNTKLDLYKKGDLSWEDLALEINKKMIKRFEIIKKIARQSIDFEKQTGNASLYASWPFVEGNNGKPIRTPLMFIPVSIEYKNGYYLVKKTNGPIKINIALIHSMYSQNRELPIDLSLYFDSIKDIFKAYSKHGITFTNELSKLTQLESLKEQKRDDYPISIKIKTFKLLNHFVLENILNSEDIYNDSLRIIRDFDDFVEPNKNLDFFNNNKLEKKYELLPMNLDKEKNQIVSSSLEDSTVIFGPPGTGKSEVITSFLVKALFDNFSNLVVAEKNVALEVLLNRLKSNYELDDFAIKLSSDGLKKDIFWKKIRRLLKIIKASSQIQAKNLPKIENKFISFENKRYKFLKKLEKNNLKSPIFWKNFNEIKIYRETLNSFKKGLKIKDEILDFQKYFQKLEIDKEKLFDYKQIINDLKFKQNNTRIEFENLNKKILDLLKPPICYLPISEIDWILFASLIKEPKKLFKYLSNNHHFFLNIKREFKKNHYEINLLISFFKQKQSMISNDEINNFERQIKHYLKICDKLDKEINCFHNMYPNFEYENLIFQNLVHLKIDQINKLDLVEELAKEYYEERFGEVNIIHEEYYEEMEAIYKKSKKIFQNQIINHIVKKINNDFKLLEKAESLYNISGYSLRKQVDPAKIIRSDFDIISTLFPIIIATPIEVSKYLPNDPNIFNYGIFDEASQMLLERAYPSIHRSKKIIVSGDDKQLAPSRWFKQAYFEEEEYSDFLNPEQISLSAESLLDWAKTKYKTEFLEKHYRSSSAALIEYSNITFYEGKLKSYDSPIANANPIELHEIKGIWNNNTNEEEADEIIQKILLLKNEFKSIGVITMNFKQRNLILEKIEGNKELAKMVYQKDSEVKIFVRNIENVQGDEADVILFSLAYAPKDGVMRLGLSFLTPNRLNVAITRAKHKMIIYKSFKSFELGGSSIDSGSRRGKNILYKWIKWLEEKYGVEKFNYDHPVISHQNIFRSTFEEEFYDIMVREIDFSYKDRYIVKSNYKINGYELDLIIFDLINKKYHAAIELDGETYHSSPEQIAKDIEKTEFLESLGWKIIRIPSTEFWKNKEMCVKKSIKFLNL